MTHVEYTNALNLTISSLSSIKQLNTEYISTIETTKVIVIVILSVRILLFKLPTIISDLKVEEFSNFIIVYNNNFRAVLACEHTISNGNCYLCDLKLLLRTIINLELIFVNFPA